MAGDAPRIALDAMGGDHMPGAALEGAAAAAAEGVRVVLVGDEAVLGPRLASLGPGVELVHAADAIAMDDHAADVRRRRDASVVVAARLVRSEEHTSELQ